MSDAGANLALLLGVAVCTAWLGAATAAVRRRRTAPVVRVGLAAAGGAAAGLTAAALGVPFEAEREDWLYWGAALSVLALAAPAAHGFGLWALLAAWRAAEEPDPPGDGPGVRP